jgi:hypothetical protein
MRLPEETSFTLRPRVNEALEIIGRLPVGALGESHGRLHLGAGFALEALIIMLGHEARTLETRGEGDDRALHLPRLDFCLVPVQLRVEHRVGAEPIGAQLQEHRALAAMDARHRGACGFLDGEHIHAIDRHRVHAVALGLEMNVGLGLGESERRAHRIQVVFAQEQHR